MTSRAITATAVYILAFILRRSEIRTECIRADASCEMVTATRSGRFGNQWTETSGQPKSTLTESATGDRHFEQEGFRALFWS
jgi:hypothetical protein